MRIDKRFSFENLGISVIIHAALVLALAVFAAAAPARKVIAPDRIKIIDIDLRDVNVSGLETVLKNQDADAGAPGPAEKPKAAAPEKKPAAKPAPVVREIRVNRETVAPDRAMTVSVVDALRLAMTRCWNIDQARADLAGIRAVAHIRLWPNGRVRNYWFEQAARAERDPAFGYVVETIRRALAACGPFSMLPRGEYEKWKSVQLTFFPTAKQVE